MHNVQYVQYAHVQYAYTTDVTGAKYKSKF